MGYSCVFVKHSIGLRIPQVLSCVYQYHTYQYHEDAILSDSAGAITVSNSE